LDPGATERVELVDEDDAWRLRLGLRKQVSHPGRTDANEHLDELRAAETEERNFRLTGHRAREQRLAGSRRTDQQHALWYATPERRVLPRVPQELDDLLEFLLGLVHASNVGEAHLDVVFGKHPVLAARKRHDAAFGAAEATGEVAPDHEDENERQDPTENLGQPPADELARVLHAGRVEILEQLRIFDSGRAEVLAAVGLTRESATDRLFADIHFGDLTAANGHLEIAVRNLAPGWSQKPRLDQDEQQQPAKEVPDWPARPPARPERAPIALALVARVES
jgi:hypothetical protein